VRDRRASRWSARGCGGRRAELPPRRRLPPGIAVTDSTGRFRLDALAPGTVELEAYAADVGRGFGTATVVEGKTAGGLVIVLDEPAGEDEPPASGNLAVTLGERGDPPEVVVVHVAADSEAERSGIRAGDVVLEVDGVEVVDMADARARLAGRAGSDVVVTVQRGEGEAAPRGARAVRR
jgi:membrane-associated protease RseP (regulator of RpoE activity)